MKIVEVSTEMDILSQNTCLTLHIFMTMINPDVCVFRHIRGETHEKTDLTQGSILKGLILMALPIMGTSFLQMAYNLTDMIWIGRLGSRAVAAVGTAGFYPWLGFAVIRLTQVGVEVWVSQSIGRRDESAARKYARSAVQMNFVLAFYSVWQ